MKTVISRQIDMDIEYLQPNGSWSTERKNAKEWSNEKDAERHAKKHLYYKFLKPIPGTLIVIL